MHLYGDYDPQIDGELVVPGQKPVPVRFTIDTGAGGTIVSTPLVDNYRLIDAVGKTVATQDEGVGGAQPTEVMGRLSALRIGPYVVAKPVVALSRDKVGSLADAGISVNLGGNILRRFTLIIDYARNSVTLEPNEHFGEPFAYDASGLLLSAEGDDFRTFVVQSVIKNSPASESGLRKGDQVTAIDGKSLDSLALWQVDDKLKESGSTVELTINRGGKTFTQPLQLRALI